MARPARLDALEARALLSASVISNGPPGGAWDGEHSPTAEVATVPIYGPLPMAESENGSGPLHLPEPETPGVLMPLQELRKVAMDSPWRIASLQQFRRSWGQPDPGPPPGLDHLSFAPEAAVTLPVGGQIRIDGSVTSAEQGHLFRLALGPQDRSIRLSFESLLSEGADPIPHRVWISNARGKILDSWIFDGSSPRLELQIRALFPPSPTVFFLGIETAGFPGSMAGTLAYSLEVQRDISPIVFQFPASSLTQGESFVPISGLPSWPEYGESPIFRTRLPGSSQGAVAGFQGNRPPFDASSSDRLTMGEVGVNVSSPLGVGRGLVRPLPIQSASAVGGLLPAGPAVRGDGATAGRSPQDGGLDEDLGEVAEAILADGRGPNGRAEAESGFAPGWEIPNLLLDSEGPGRVPSSISNSSAIALSRPGGPSGLPTLGEGLRVVWGRPPILPTRDLTPEVDEFSAIALPPFERPPRDAAATRPSAEVDDPESEIDSTRPRVLRTALIGVAALAVGMLLPDLTAERPLLLHRQTWPRGPRRSLRPRVS